MMRQAWIDKGDGVTGVRPCVLAGGSRATVYARQKRRPVDESDLLFSRLIDEEYTRRPFYGRRKRVVFLMVAGHTVNRKRAQRLMREMGLAGRAPGPNTRRPHPGQPLPAAGCSSGPAKPGLEYGHHLYTTIGWLRLPIDAGGDYRRGLAPGAQLADQQQHGSDVLYRLPGRSFARPRQTGNLQQRSRFAVHPHCLHRSFATGKYRDQHGWPGASIGQHLRRAALAQRQA